MKRFYGILTLAVLVLFSFNVNAQTKPTQDLACAAGDVEIVIGQIIWNATPEDLDAYADDSGDSGIGNRVENEDIPLPGSGQYPTVFHIVEISFDKSANFDQYVNWTVIPHIEVFVSTVNYDTDVPIYVVYDTDANPGVTPNAGGFRIRNITTGTGVTSTLAIMGRSASYEPDPSWDCIEIYTPNRVVRLQNAEYCYLGETTYGNCSPVLNVPNPPAESSKMDMSDSSTVSVYPNPVQNNLFIENNGIDINELSIMALDGQVLNHKASIRTGIDRTQINTSQLDTGIYLLQLNTSTGTIVKKIIVQ